MTDLYVPDLPDDVTPVDAAHAYARGGLYVVPVPQRSKNPGALLGADWPGKSTRSGADITCLWEDHPRAGVGLHVGRSGLVVLDVDDPARLDDQVRHAIIETQPPFQVTRAHAEVGEVAEFLALERGELRGHALFRVPPGRILGNSLGRLDKGWGDIRGLNGFIVTAPTVHEKHTHGGRYRWLRTGVVPVLPEAVASLLPDGAEGDAAATDEQVKAFIARYGTVPGKRWPKLIDAAVKRFEAEVARGGGRHHEGAAAATWAAREAAAGAIPAGLAFADLFRSFERLVSADPGPHKTRRQVGGIRREWDGIVAWAVGQAIGTDPARLAEVRTRLKLTGPPPPGMLAPQPVEAPQPAQEAQEAQEASGVDWSTLDGATPPEDVHAAPDGPPDTSASTSASTSAPDDGRPVDVPAGARPLPTLPQDFWEERDYLRDIREAAHMRCASADVVFHATLARLSAMVPHWATVDTGIGGAPASLNYFAAIVSDSGVGKSSDFAVAGRVLERRTGFDFLDEVPLGSGEGLAELFMGEVDADPVGGDGHDDGSHRGASPRKKPKAKPEKVRAQVRHNAFVVADEGASMTELMHGRKGSTLGATLRSAWAGLTLGNANASKDRYRVIPAGSYALGLCVGFQRETAGPLLADHVAGTPQRFAWVSATDWAIPAQRPARVSQPVVRWEPEAFGFDPVRGHGLTMADTIKDRLWAERRAKKAGEETVESLDSHKPLFFIKVAGLLAILDKRTHIDEDDWRLAGVVWETSAAVRSALLRHIEHVERERNEAFDSAHARRQVKTAEALERAADEAVVRTAKLIGRYVHAAPGITVKAAKRKLDSRARDRFDAALDVAIGRGWVVEDGEMLQPGASKPADG